MSLANNRFLRQRDYDSWKEKILTHWSFVRRMLHGKRRLEKNWDVYVVICVGRQASSPA